LAHRVRRSIAGRDSKGFEDREGFVLRCGLGFVAIDPERRQTVYAGTDRGVFWTPDGGESWRQFTRLPLRTFGALAVDPAAGLVYAGADGGGIFELRLGH
jgi:hypothetical protein